MQLPEFKRYIETKIKELESMPYHGQEFPESSYTVDGVERVPVFDESEFLDYCGYLVREILIDAAKFGFVVDPPPKLICRDDALFFLRQVAASLEQSPTKGEASEPTIAHDGPYRVREAANITRISERKIYQDCSAGKIQHSKNPIRISKESLEEYQRKREQDPIKTTGFRHL